MLHTIHTPKITNVEEHEENSATFTIEPLYNGYGVTLGNSMRRVLLSSLSGAAANAFRLEGTNHEFSTIDGIKEDGVAIMLNVKKLRFKVYADEPQTVRISKKGTGPVTGADIEETDAVEVVNKDQEIATLDNDKTKFEMDIIVEKGRSYVPSEEREDDLPADFIAIDALYSPVTRVRYNTENTRVGRVTDLDKLLLTIDTDGTITPEDALEEAAEILVGQFQVLAGNVEEPVEEPEEDEDEEEEDEILLTPIEDLNLSARTTNALVNNDVHTIKELVTLSDAELKDLKGFGAKALEEVQEKLSELDI